MTLMNAAKAEGLAEGREEGIKEGREEGIIEGIEEGKKITMLEIAKKAIENGLTNDFIKQFTGLTDNEIDSLRNS
jgi:predicted transposase/invertase (TIGR01784 family)